MGVEAAALGDSNCFTAEVGERLGLEGTNMCRNCREETGAPTGLPMAACPLPLLRCVRCRDADAS